MGCLHQSSLIVTKSYSDRAVGVREASYVVKGRWARVSDAYRHANNYCDSAIVQ
jgi:hypothetical protein